MFSGSCFKENCQNKLFAKCDCEGNILFCQEHAFEHWAKPSANRHQLIQQFVKPDEETKYLVIQKLSNLKKEIQVYRQEAIANASQVIKSFKETFAKYLDQISEVDRGCSKMIEGMQNQEEFLDVAEEDDMESVLRLDALEAQGKMAGWSTKWSYLDYKKIHEAIRKAHEIIFNPFRIIVKEEVESSELSFFRHNTSNFCTISLESLQVLSTTTLATQETIHANTSTCMLPDKTYFYCYNPSGSSGLTFIVDKNKNAKLLQKSKVNHYLDPVFYNDFIYLLGGDKELAERYDIRQNKWESMAPLPHDLNFNYSCTTLFGDSILMIGYYLQKIICYSILQNNYKDIPNLLLEKNCYKLMLRGNNRIYLFEKGKRIFESAENDVSKWAQIGCNAMSNGNHSAIVRYKGSLYFVEHDSQLWKFDLSSKQLSQVKKV